MPAMIEGTYPGKSAYAAQSVSQTATEAARSAQVHAAISILQGRIASLADISQTLIARLNCVSMIHPPKPETANGGGSPVLCALAESIDSLARQAEAIAEQLSDQIVRLEL